MKFFFGSSSLSWVSLFLTTTAAIAATSTTVVTAAEDHQPQNRLIRTSNGSSTSSSVTGGGRNHKTRGGGGSGPRGDTSRRRLPASEACSSPTVAPTIGCDDHDPDKIAVCIEKPGGKKSAPDGTFIHENKCIDKDDDKIAGYIPGTGDLYDDKYPLLLCGCCDEEVVMNNVLITDVKYPKSYDKDPYCLDFVSEEPSMEPSIEPSLSEQPSFSSQPSLSSAPSVEQCPVGPSSDDPQFIAIYDFDCGEVVDVPFDRVIASFTTLGPTTGIIQEPKFFQVASVDTTTAPQTIVQSEVLVTEGTGTETEYIDPGNGNMETGLTRDPFTFFYFDLSNPTPLFAGFNAGQVPCDPGSTFDHTVLSVGPYYHLQKDAGPNSDKMRIRKATVVPAATDCTGMVEYNVDCTITNYQLIGPF